MVNEALKLLSFFENEVEIHQKDKKTDAVLKAQSGNKNSKKLKGNKWKHVPQLWIIDSNAFGISCSAVAK